MERAISRLKLIRWKKGLTQRELAEKAGLPVWKISKWEEKRRFPTLSEARQVQEVLPGNFLVYDPSEIREKCRKGSLVK